MDMELFDNAKVCTLLLDFCSLSKADQAVFVEGLNRYMFVSPGKRRSLIDRWNKSLATQDVSDA
jgi:hypothetical protein